MSRQSCSRPSELIQLWLSSPRAARPIGLRLGAGPSSVLKTKQLWEIPFLVSLPLCCSFAVQLAAKLRYRLKVDVRSGLVLGLELDCGGGLVVHETRGW
jgi:hypothetical protein